VIVVHAEGHPVQALLDSGSLTNFISTTLVDQLKIEYQNIKEGWHFDIINIDNYDMILRTPFIFQHKVLAGSLSSTLHKL
jgi:hypothetical protein